MNILTNGPYHYFLPGQMGKIPPRLCEISQGYAYFMDDGVGGGDVVPLDKLTGTFIRLIETGLPFSVRAADSIDSTSVSE